MTTGIYKLDFKGTDKCYIGQSVNIEKRFKQHLNDLKVGNHNYKLLQAYNLYGNPALDVLIECTSDELDVLEAEAIEIFNSVNEGFNIYSCPNQAPVLKGVDSGNSKYSREQLIQAYKLLAKNPELSYNQIYELTQVSVSTLSNLVQKSVHVWLIEEFPDLALSIDSVNIIRKNNNNLKRAEYCKTHNTAKAKGIHYPDIVSPDNILYSVENVQEFARNHSISKSSLHRILTRETKSCKGWRLA